MREELSNPNTKGIRIPNAICPSEILNFFHKVKQLTENKT